MNEVISRDPVAVEGHHVERERAEALVRLVPGVAAHRRLAVRARGHVAPAPVARQRPEVHEAAEVLVPAEPGRQRRHRPGGVLGEHARRPPPRRPAASRPCSPPRARAGARRRARAGWPAGSARGASSSIVLRARWRALFTEATVVSSDSATSRAEKPEHLAQDQGGALVGRQVLERRHERELDALAQLVARLGPGQAVLEAQPLVRIGLHPDRLGRGQADAVVGVGGRAVVERQHRAWAGARSG